jgi:cell division protein FtsB
MKKILLFFLSFLLISLHYRLWMSHSNVIDLFRLQSVIKTEKDGIAALTLRNQKLDAEVKVLKIHPEVLEDRARSELGMVKAKETFYLVVYPGR